MLSVAVGTDDSVSFAVLSNIVEARFQCAPFALVDRVGQHSTTRFLHRIKYIAVVFTASVVNDKDGIVASFL
ncbi:hypothetical protein D3C86_2091270 [compost metagenome]